MSSTVIADPRSVSAVTPVHRRLPVGARFPRTWPDPTIDPQEMVFQPIFHSARVFPVGCRFPRRSVADALAYLATRVPTTPGARPAPVPPVGAPFPRRPQRTTYMDRSAG